MLDDIEQARVPTRTWLGWAFVEPKTTASVTAANVPGMNPIRTIICSSAPQSRGHTGQILDQARGKDQNFKRGMDAHNNPGLPSDPAHW
jgi:hypothetical protein